MTRAARSADNTVHDLIAVANDLRRHLDHRLADAGYEDRRPAFAPLLSRVWRGGVPQGQLAEALGVSPQAASQTVGLAVRAGFVAKAPNPGDGRSKLVVLTELGRAFVADGATAITRRAAEYSGMLGPRRFARFDLILRRLRAGMQLGGSDDPIAYLAPTTSIMVASTLAEDALRSLHAAMRDAGHRRITNGQNLVLVHIGPDGARSSELARVQGVSRQAVSALLHDLEELRYVRRRHDASDGRGVVFVPTAKGRRVLDDYVAGIDAIESRYAAILGERRFDELVGIARDLRRLVVLEDVFAPTPGEVSVDVPSARRQAELVDMGTELLRWLGDVDAWWLTGHLRRRVLDRLDASSVAASSTDRAR